MQWTDEAIVLGVKRHGETSVILELMTAARGRHLGLVRGGTGKRLRGVLQPGNSVSATWRARLDEHLGNYAVEGVNLRAAGFLSAAHAVHGVTHLAALCRLLAEREPHARIHRALEAILDALDDPAAVAPMVARFELDFLAELGFGLDLASCAATGATEDLVYVSPRSGRAVSRAAGFLAAAHAVHGVTHLAALCRLLAEREPHARIHATLEEILDALDDPAAVAPMIARFELSFLAELGFGLDLSSCAATGAKDDLIYVSPRSGRAVSRAGGEDYRDKLMRLPAFLRTEADPASAGDLANAFALTGFFLERHAFAPRGMALPDARGRFISAVLVHNGQPRYPSPP